MGERTWQQRVGLWLLGEPYEQRLERRDKVEALAERPLYIRDGLGGEKRLATDKERAEKGLPPYKGDRAR